MLNDVSNPVISTAAALAAANPVLYKAQGASETDTGISKVGDGVTPYNSLSYFDPPQEYSTASGTDTYVATLKIAGIFGYFPGMRLRIKFANANTGAATINVNGLGAEAIKKNVSSALIAADIPAGAILELIYDGTNFQIPKAVGASAGSTPTLAQVLSAGNDGGGLEIKNIADPTAAQSAVTRAYGDANYAAISSGVLSFNTRTGAVTLTSGDVTTALGYTPVTNARTLTINGSAQDLSANRTWTITTTGTSNRISVSGGTGLTPTIDIDPAYVGQTSITTLGTITTGVWNGTAISLTSYASGTLQAAQFPALTGDVTTVAGALATTIGALKVATGMIQANAVTYAKMQALSGTSLLLGSSSTTTPVQEITIGTGLSLSGTTLTASGSGGTVTSVAWTTSQGVSASIANSTTTPNITITLGALTGVTSFNGLVITANTGVVTTGTWNASLIGLAYGGSNKNMTAVNGGIVWTDADSMEVTAAGSAGQIFRSGGAGTPTWSTPTFPNAATTGKFLQGDGTNIILSAYTFPTSVGAVGTILRSDGTNWIATTNTFPNTIGSGQILYATSANIISGSSTFLFDGSSLIIGGTATLIGEKLSIQTNLNSNQYLNFSNISAGNAATIQHQLTNGTAIAAIYVYGTGYSAGSAYDIANNTVLFGNTGDLNIVNGSAKSIKLWVNNSTQAMFINSSGLVTIGSTTAGARLLNVNKNQNAGTLIGISNTTSGAASYAALNISSSATQLELDVYSATTTAYGALVSNAAAIYCTNNLVLMADSGTNGLIVFASGGNAERWRIDLAGGLTNTSGTANVGLDINNGLAVRQNTKTQIVANTNNYAIGAQTSFRMSTDASRNITGMTGGVDGKLLVIRNVGSFNIVFTNEDAGSTAANRFTMSTGGNITVAANGSIIFQYDATASRWFDIATR